MCNLLPEQLITYLQSNFTVRPLDQKTCVVVTPFLHFDMSCIELFVEPSSTGYTISDGGETLSMLFVSGLTVEENPGLMEEAFHIATMHGVQFKDSAISIQTTPEHMAAVTHRLIHTIQAIGFFIYYRNQQKVPTFQDVGEYAGVLV